MFLQAGLPSGWHQTAAFTCQWMQLWLIERTASESGENDGINVAKQGGVFLGGLMAMHLLLYYILKKF